MVGKMPPLPLRLMLRAFQPVSLRVSLFCSWRKRPPDLLCRRQPINNEEGLKRGWMAWNIRRNVSEAFCQPSEFLHLRDKKWKGGGGGSMENRRYRRFGVRPAKELTMQNR